MIRGGRVEPAAELTGLRFGKLVALKKTSTSGHAAWLWQCDCGTQKVALATNVKTGKISSCGCYQAERRTRHGQHASRTYGVWQDMKARCKGSSGLNRKYYLERGIRVCDRWLDFSAFLADMGECPEGMTLDRIDNDKGYEPGNCRWANRKTQRLNSRRVHLVTVAGEETCLLYACRRKGISYRTAMKRMARGFTAQQALDYEVE